MINDPMAGYELDDISEPSIIMSALYYHLQLQLQPSRIYHHNA
jgi:hypothetical protein